MRAVKAYHNQTSIHRLKQEKKHDNVNILVFFFMCVYELSINTTVNAIDGK